MGLTYLTIDIGSPARPEATVPVECMVDSGAVYTVASADLLEELGIDPLSKETFWLANGEKVVRRRGIALFRYGDRVGGADVVFGEEGDSNLLGATTLESLGLSLDPLKCELKPNRMTIGGFWPDR